MRYQTLQTDCRFGLFDIQNHLYPINFKLESFWLLFVLDGSVIIKRDNSAQEEISANTVFLFSPNVACQIKKATSCLLYFYIIDVDCFLSEITMSSKPPPKSFQKLLLKGEIANFVKVATNIADEDACIPSVEQLMGKLLFRLFNLYHHKYELYSFFHPLATPNFRFKDFIEKNCLKVKTIDELAQLANYSTSGFVKKFHRYYNQSPQKWISEYKAKRILQDIRIGDKSSSEITDYYGFSSIYHFYTFCRKTFNCSFTELKNGMYDHSHFQE